MNNPLRGNTTREQVIDLLTRIKANPLSVEELEKLVPMEQTFIQEFASCLKEEIQSDTAQHSSSISAINNCIDLLKEMVKDNLISNEEKHNIANYIHEISKELINMENKRSDNSNKIKKIAIVTLGIIVGVPLLILTAGKVNLLPKGGNNA